MTQPQGSETVTATEFQETVQEKACEFFQLLATARTAQQYGQSNDEELDAVWSAVEQAEASFNALLGK